MEEQERGCRSRRSECGTATHHRIEAAALHAEGRLEEAEAQALIAAKKLAKDNSLEGAKVYNTLAAIRLDLWKPTQAHRDSRKACECAGLASQPGEDADIDRERIRSLCLLARCHMEAGYPERAKPIVERAIAMAHHWLNPLSEEKVHALVLQAAIAREAGDIEEAKESLMQALEIAKQLWDPYHGEVASICHQIALLAPFVENAIALEPYARQGYEIRCSIFGSAHPITAAAMTSLAQVLEACGEHELAGERFLHAMAIFDRHYATEHFDYSINLQSLRDYAQCREGAARHLFRQSRHEDAKEFSKRAQKVFETVLGRSHHLTKEWSKHHDSIVKASHQGRNRNTRYNPWDWWRSLSFSR